MGESTGGNRSDTHAGSRGEIDRMFTVLFEGKTIGHLPCFQRDTGRAIHLDLRAKIVDRTFILILLIEGKSIGHSP